MATKYTKRPKNSPSGHEIYQHLPFQHPAKFTQSGIFGLKNAIWQPWFSAESCIPVAHLRFIKSQKAK
jgi:hypothetical protein